MLSRLRIIPCKTLRQLRNGRFLRLSSTTTSTTTAKLSTPTSTTTVKLSTQTKPFVIPYPSSTTPSTMTIQKHVSDYDEQMLVITWEDGSTDRYPFIYLRDNCQCTKCFHEQCQQRLILTMTLDLNTKPTATQLNTDGEQISITWADGHSSIFNSDWLYERRFPKKQDIVDMDKKSVNGENTILWDSSLNGQIPHVDYEEVMQDDLALFHWMDILSKMGLAIMGNTPALPGQLSRLADRVGHLKTTNYGDVFDVRTVGPRTNIAFTPHSLPLHIDMPYYEYQPGIQLLHCIEQYSGEGGTNHLVDGFMVAQQLKDQDPEGYKFLCTTPRTFVDIGSDYYGDYHLRHTRPVIELDNKGNIKCINFNNPVQDSILKFPVEKVMAMYRIYLKIGQLMYDPQNLVEKKLKPGEILSFNNRRCMHGRTAYNPDQGGTRWLQGIYFDWDCVFSKMRVIATKHQLETHIWW